MRSPPRSARLLTRTLADAATIVRLPPRPAPRASAHQSALSFPAWLASLSPAPGGTPPRVEAAGAPPAPPPPSRQPLADVLEDADLLDAADDDEQSDEEEERRPF